MILICSALEDGDVHVTSAGVPAVVLDDEQSWCDDLQHEAERRDRARRAPHAHLAIDVPHAEMDAGPLNGRGDAHERAGGKGQRTFEDERLKGAVWRQQRQGDLGNVAFFAAQAACPEGRVDDGLDRL